MRVHGIQCSHVTRLAAVYPELLKTNAQLLNIIEARFSIEQLLHNYWYKDRSLWHINDILLSCSKMGTRGQHVRAEVQNYQKQMHVSADDVKSDDLPPNTNMDTKEQYTEKLLVTYKAKLETQVLYSDIKGLSDQMHRVADSHSLSMQYSLRQ